MGQAIGDMLPMAVGVAVSPLPIVAVVLMLVSSRGRANGPAFLVGWLVGVLVAGAVVLALAGGANANDDGARAEWTSWLELLLGLSLFRLAAKQWRGRPHGDEEPLTPRWMGELDTLTPAKAAVAGVALAALNPKNVVLIVAGMAAVAQTGISTGDQIACLLLFAVIAAIGVAVPVVISFAMGDRSQELLAGLKTWMARNNGVIIAVLLLIIGVKLVGNAIAGLSD